MRKLMLVLLLGLFMVGFGSAALSIETADAGSVTGTYEDEVGTYTNVAVDDTTYWSFGDNSIGAMVAYSELTYDLTGLGVSEDTIENLSFILTYCHSGENVAPDCDGDAAIEGTVNGAQNVEAYNYSSAAWVDIGDLATDDGENEVSGQWSIGVGWADFVEDATDNVNVRYELDYSNDAANQDSWLVLDYAVLNVTYDGDAPETSINNVAGDTTATYYDTVNDSQTNITIDGEAGMLCRWGTSDAVYSSMSPSQECEISSTQAICITTPVEGEPDFYVSCKDSVGNEQVTDSAQANGNEDIDSLVVDWTAPNTTDDSSVTVIVPDYTVTISEQDNVDADPTTLYCTDTVNSCVPSITIDDGGIVTFTSANRGVNYLRYNSSDDAGNTQAVQSSMININRLPTFTSASDNATTIGGDELVNITTVSVDDDAQQITLWVCNSTNVTFEGCGDTEYCNVSGSSNVTCVFTAESDSASHTWYAYLFDDSDETAATNFTGSYTTDVTSPSITLVSPTNGSTITQDSVTFTINVDEALSSAWYSLNGGTNVTMTNSSLLVYAHTNSSIADGLYYMTFWANDSYGNDAILTGNSFTIDTAVADTTAPTVTVQSPVADSYDTDGNVLLNITMDEDILWAGYTNNSGTLTDLDNTSLTAWNATVTFVEGQHDFIFYANDSSDNQGNATVTVYVDLTNASVTTFSCTDVNDSVNVVCTIAATDVIGLKEYKVGYNATGTWVNSSLISFTGTSNSSSFTILSGNHSPVGFSTKLYVYDLSGRLNDTETDDIVISDDTLPVINNYTYVPNATDDLDPNVEIDVNATITEDYNISDVYLMYWNTSSPGWNYVAMNNNSVLTVGSASTVIYNGSFTPEEGTWTFRINATDFAGNGNVTENVTVVVANDTSEDITTTIPAVKSITYAQQTVNNSLGRLVMNNTGDALMSFNVSLAGDAEILDRLSVNYTGVLTGNFSTASLATTNITIDVNTTGLIAGLYDYNITIVSDVGTTVLEKQLNIQVALGPYLVTSITTYDSDVTQGDSGVEYVATVTNLGTSDATGVYLNWTLPSGFSLASGNLNRSLGALGVSVSGTNTITIDVGSSATTGDVSIVANATSSNADSASDTKTITIGSLVAPVTPPTVTPPSGGGGTTGVTIGGGEYEVYDKEIEVVRGDTIEFEIEIYNKFQNSTLENLEITLNGFPEQHISIVPLKILSIGYNQMGVFVVTIDAPIYQSYEEYDLKATIVGTLVRSEGIEVSYKEIQNIKLIVQAVSEEVSRISLTEAEKALQDMIDAGFNVDEAQRLFDDAMIKIDSNRNKQAKDLADELVVLSERAFETDALMRSVMHVLTNPRKSRVLLKTGISGFAIENFDVDNYFEGHPAVELIELARVAFDRGDYALAKKRADSARTMLLFSIKGNLWLLILLYWPFILFGGLILLVVGIFGLKKYRKSAITRRIDGLNKKGENIRKLIRDSQVTYFAGKMSASEYHRVIEQHQNKLSDIKKTRIRLRNQRIKMLKPREVIMDLKLERMQIEGEIKELQTDYYKGHKISEQEYKLQFEILNGRLAEIEDERTTLSLDRNRKLIKAKQKAVKKVKVKEEKVNKRGKINIFGFLMKHREKKRVKEEEGFRERINEMFGGQQ